MQKDKLFYRIAVGISIIVFLLVIALNRRILNPPETYPNFIHTFPMINAFINGTCAILLMLSFRAIKRKKIQLHKKLNITTFVLSALFLILYVVFHFFVDQTYHQGEGVIKILYYIILVAHIVLAAVVLPLILISFYYALNNKVEKHRKIVRFTFPIWLFVTVSGVLVYLMISPYYPF